MSVAKSPAAVLDRLPDAWQGSRWRELDGGLSNTTWLLDNGAAQAVLKFDAEPRGLPYRTRVDEARLQSLAAAAGLATRVLHVEDGLLLSEYVAGEVWCGQSFRDTGRLEQLADALLRLHALPSSGIVFNALQASRYYADRIHGSATLVAQCVSVAERVGAPQELRFCHNDLVAENILWTSGVRFLDWEFAGDNDPLFDLATIIEHHELSETLSLHLLDAYFDGEGATKWHDLERQRRLYIALLWLWLASRPDSTPDELDRVAERVVTSCS